MTPSTLGVREKSGAFDPDEGRAVRNIVVEYKFYMNRLDSM